MFSLVVDEYLVNLIRDFDDDVALEVKILGDVKAFVRAKCGFHDELLMASEFFQKSCSCEDINILGSTLVLKATLDRVLFTAMGDIVGAMCTMAKDLSSCTMCFPSHGKGASFTTLGKEIAVYAIRLQKELKKMSEVQFAGNFGGIVTCGVVYPGIHWPTIAQEFVQSLGLSFDPYQSQIEPQEFVGSLFHSVMQFNNILTDFVQDIARYVSLTYFKVNQAKVDDDWNKSMDNPDQVALIKYAAKLAMEVAP